MVIALVKCDNVRFGCRSTCSGDDVIRARCTLVVSHAKRTGAVGRPPSVDLIQCWLLVPDGRCRKQRRLLPAVTPPAVHRIGTLLPASIGADDRVAQVKVCGAAALMVIALGEVATR